jgi:hypothetical protein
MPYVFRPSEAAQALRLGGSLLACSALAVVLFAFGKPDAALGAGLGLALHLGNAMFLYLTLASLVERGASAASPRHGALAAGASFVGRLLFLGFALWLIASELGREVFLGAGGGLVLAQISLLFRRFGAEGGV